MTNSSNYLGEFNARCLSPEEVAQRFVVIPQFYRLLNTSHSILLGPRGSGKTTLLKMLTTPALNIWEAEQEKATKEVIFKRPEFESIYIPSDIRWAYELVNIANDTEITSHQASLLQRSMVNAGILSGMLDCFEQLAIETNSVESDVCIKLINHWGLNGVMPLFRDLRVSILQVVNKVRAEINLSNNRRIKTLINDLSSIFFGHVLDTPISSCLMMQEYFSPKKDIKRWALCFDELEIAPEWLREEVLESLRSVQQPFLLKLTWSPLLPTGLKSAPEPMEDYAPIRLWHSHIPDARAFCEDLTSRFLENCFPGLGIKPDGFFSQSLFGRDDEVDARKTSYERGSTIYNEFKALAEEDMSFKEFLIKIGMDPTDPFTDDISIRDRYLRKIKPVVLIRRVFLNEEGSKRSRKQITLYAGKEAIYAMSEANPRWLLGLLTDLYDRWKSKPKYGYKNMPYITYQQQAKTLNSAARRYESFLSATAAGTPSSNISGNKSLLDCLRDIGTAIQENFLGTDFPLDPFGSFKVDKEINQTILTTLQKAIQLGALIYVGKADEDIPSKEIVGERFRLTFMLAPVFKLPLRNYREISLSTILKIAISSKQMNLFD